jgi:hypothetical protein
MKSFREAIRRALTAPCRLSLEPFLRAGEHQVRRTAWARLQNILAILKTGEAFNSTKLAKISRVSTKAIKRDVAFLKKQGLKINFDFTKNSYRLIGEIPPNFKIITGGGQ